MMKRCWVSFRALGLVCLLCACGDSTGSAGGGGDTGQGGEAVEGGAPQGGGELGGGDAQPLAEPPTLDEVLPMHGGLHLFWTNVSSDCDSVEGEHKTSTSQFVSFFSVPGTIDNEMDDTATDPAETYTYRVRCKRGEQYSGYSNEVSASPE